MQRTVIVTGCSSGIGAATAKFLKQQNHRVIGFDLNEPSDNVDQFIAIDINSYEAIDQALAKMNESADALCNIAGVPPTAPASAQLMVNYLGLKYFTHGIINHLNDNASIVNLASLAGMGWEQRLDVIKQLDELGNGIHKVF